MRVAFVSAEVHPFSKTGGLADVADALPRALTELGADVTVFTPGYGTALERLDALGIASHVHHLAQELWIGDQRHPLSYRIATYEGRRIVFVLNPAFYHRPHFYCGADGHDYADNVDRFAFFCRAVLELCRTEVTPDVFHANDWQAALIPVYLKTLYRDPPLAAARALFTIHNLTFQGQFGPEMLYATGLNWDIFHPEGLEFWGGLNLMKGGIVFSDAVTTVSPTYAEEIQTPAHGKGLDGVMRAQRHKLRGILNGIDARQWDPAADPHLPARYSADDLKGKAVCKRALQQQFELAPNPQTFLLGAVGRFDVQKGIHLILAAFPHLAELDIQLVMLGTGDRDLEARARQLAAAYPQRMGLRIEFDESLAHLIEAGADAFLMPSEHEPCGLNQMYSQRYGTIPIVHETGGLKDTVTDFTRRSLAAGQASGFSFATFTTDGLIDAVHRAARLYGEEPDTWRALMRHCLRLDHTWTTSARAYLELCEALVSPPPPAVPDTPGVTENDSPGGHTPVLLQEVLEHLAPRPAGRYVDATINGGGHSRAILTASAPDGRVLGIDRDPELIAALAARMAPDIAAGRLQLANASFRSLSEILAARAFGPVDGIALDLGLSSFHFDASGRGFSFARDEPLDMRFDPTDDEGESAAAIVASRDAGELTTLFRDYGEERFASRIARSLVARRREQPITTTRQLFDVIERTLPANTRWRAARHAARVFQALRIAANCELDAVAAVLPQAVAALAPGGRLVVISFHSLEDRLVKHFLRDEKQAGRMRILTKRPILPSEAEVAANPRAGSAKLRAAERV